MPDVWRKATITHPPELEEAIANYLFELGAAGIVNKEGAIEAYFERPGPPEELRSCFDLFIKEQNRLSLDTSSVSLQMEDIENRDWNAEWKKSFKTQKISESIIIKPSWEPAPRRKPRCLIEIDPGMAFGTGTHESTILTLKLIERYLTPSSTVLDIGTGSGILAIAALKLGAKKATAFDIDPLATAATLDNATKNGVAENLLIFTGSLNDLSIQPFDLISANVNRTEIIKMVPSITAYMHKNSRLLLSGLLAAERDQMTETLAGHRIGTINTMLMGEWTALVCELNETYANIPC